MLKSFTIRNKHYLAYLPYTLFYFEEGLFPNENYQINNLYIVLTENFLCSDCNYFVRLDIGIGDPGIGNGGVVNFKQKDTGQGTETVIHWEFINGKFIPNASGISPTIGPGQSPLTYYIAPNYGRKRVEGYFVEGTNATIAIENFVALRFTQTDIPTPKALNF